MYLGKARVYGSLPTSGGLVGGGSVFGVNLSGLRFMPCGRSRSHITGLVTPLAAGPAIVPSWELVTRFGMWPHESDLLAPEFVDCAS